LITTKITTKTNEIKSHTSYTNNLNNLSYGRLFLQVLKKKNNNNNNTLLPQTPTQLYGKKILQVFKRIRTITTKQHTIYTTHNNTILWTITTGIKE